MVLKSLFISLLCVGLVYAENVNVTNSTNNPVNVTGSLVIAPATTATNVVSTYSVITSTYALNVNASFSPPAIQNVYMLNPTTTTFNGNGQPVTSTYTVISTTYPISVSASFSPPALTTVTFNNTAQQVTSTYTIVTTTAPLNVNQTNNPGTYTVTMGSGALNSVSTSTVITSTYSINTNVTNSVGVTGAFFQTTQPVSFGATNIATVTPGTGTFTISGTVTANIGNTQNTTAIQTISSSSVMTSTYPVNVADTPPTLTKGTQGTTGFSTQDLKDAGRTFVIFTATGVAGVTSEALFSFQLAKGASIVQSTNTYAVTAGKTLRIQGLYCSNRDGTTAVSWTRAVIRWNPTGTATASSPILFGTEIGDQSALAGAASNFSAPFPDGIEIPSTTGSSIGVSHLDQATTNLVSCTLVGFEY